MNKNTFLADLERLSQGNKQFLEKWKEDILAFLVKENPTADEALCQEILSDLLEYTHQIPHLIQYLGKDVQIMGELSTDQEGNVLLDGKRMSPLEEFEIYQYDNILGKMVWTRTFVTMKAQGEAPSLAGLEKGATINGIKARTR